MATSVVMPALEMAQETGKLVAWRKREGESVRKGEVLMDVETDKAVVEIEAEADGVLSGVRAREGDVVAVGQTIAWILAAGEQAPSVAEQQPTRTGRETMHASSTTGPVAPTQPAEAPGPRPMSPKARRLMAERGITVQTGSGPGGSIVAADLETAIPPATSAPGAPTSIWRLMAERMSASWSAVPHFFLTREIDAAALVELQSALKAEQSASGDITITDLLVVFVARALRRHPGLNASWTGSAVQTHASVNVGIATGVEQGVVVPVIRDADRLDARQVGERRRELVERARAGRLRPADLADGTFTISNLGMYKVDAFSAIVNAPQAAILAVGRIADRVVAFEGRAVVRPTMRVTLSCDHRVTDGVRAGAFLADMSDLLEQAERSQL